MNDISSLDLDAIAAKKARKNKAKRERSIWITLYVIFYSVITIYGAISMFSILRTSIERDYDYIPLNIAVLAIFVLGAAPLLILFLRAMWEWKRWGVYGLAAFTLISLVVKMLTNTAAGLDYISPILQIGILYLVVRPKWNLFDRPISTLSDRVQLQNDTIPTFDIFTAPTPQQTRKLDGGIVIGISLFAITLILTTCFQTLLFAQLANLSGSGLFVGALSVFLIALILMAIGVVGVVRRRRWGLVLLVICVALDIAFSLVSGGFNMVILFMMGLSLVLALMLAWGKWSTNLRMK